MCKDGRKFIQVPVGAQAELISNRWSQDKVVSYHGKISLCVEDSVANLVDKLNDIIEDYGNEYKDIRINGDRCGCYFECSCGPTYYVYGKRLENDVEYNHRIEEEKAKELRREAEELKQYEKLKKKFEGK